MCIPRPDRQSSQSQVPKSERKLVERCPTGCKRDIAKSNTYIHIYIQCTIVSLVSASRSAMPKRRTSQEIVAAGGDRCDVAIVRVCPALTERSSRARPFTTATFHPSSSSPLLSCFVPPRASLCFSPSLSVGIISGNSRSDRKRKRERKREREVGAGFLLFYPAPFSKSALKEKRTGTVFRYTVTIDQRDRTTAPAVRASRGEARRSEARRGEAKRDGGLERDGDGTTGRAGTERNGSGRLRVGKGARDVTRPDEKGARSRWGSAETKPRDDGPPPRTGGSRIRRLVFRKH